MNEDAVEELRERLRNGRNESASSASSVAEGERRSNVIEERAVSPDVRGSSRETQRNDDTNARSERGSSKESFGVGQTDRRFSKDSLSTLDSPKIDHRTKSRRVGRIEAIDEVPKRKEESKKRGRKPKDENILEEKTRDESVGARSTTVQKVTKEKIKLSWFKEGTTLTEAEIIALEQPLIAALEADFYYIDQYIWSKTQDVSEAPIWSDLDNEDVTIYARVMLKQGKKSPQAALMVRSIVSGSDYISALMLTIPRVIKTVDAMKHAPQRPKRTFLERKQAAKAA